MGKSVHIYSKLASNQRYDTHMSTGGDLPVVAHSVHIHGGANVAMGKNIITPLGVHTEITEEDYAALKENEVFKIHVKNGLIKAELKKYDVEKVVGDMGGKEDPSAPITPGSYDEDDDTKPKPTTASKK